MVKLMKVETLLGSVGNEFGNEAIEQLLRRNRGGVDKALKHIRRPQAAVGIVKSPLGDLLVAMSAGGVLLNSYLRGASDLEATIQKLRLAFDPVEDQRTVREVGAEIRRYLAGDAKALRQTVDLTLVGTSFQKKVLDKLRSVPRGALISYQALGAALQAANSARAVGNALHDNPIPIYVPCHRVISSDGRIGGYAGGAARKLQLLRSEGFELNNAQARIADTVVWGHKGSKIYCRRDCRTAAHVDRAQILFFADPRQAERAGMRPCKICRPG
jgi:O-6-methylguanine DNA methyltransferase